MGEDEGGDARSDERGDVLKSLGIKRRSRPGAGASADEAPDAAGGAEPKAASGPGLGLKRRRSGPQATISEAELEAEAESDAGAPEDWGPQAPQSPASPASPAGQVEVIDVLAPLRGKLGSDQTAVLMANYLRGRPSLIERLPARLWELERTHGRYLGDGRVERTLPVGFRPALVLYTLPLYADGPPAFTKTGELIDPGINSQPGFTDAGFRVGHAFNGLGDFYVYVVFKDDGQPLEWPADPTAKKERSRGKDGSEPKGGDALGRSLGIKRRK